MTDWRKFYLWDSLPPCPCCYVILCNSEPIYVGQTMNLKVRFYGHNLKESWRNGWALTPWGHLPFVCIKANFGRKYGDWAMREVRLIRCLRPRFNKNGNRRDA